MFEGRQQKLADFVAWSKQHITGDEKSQAHIFLDRLFQAFGQKGCLDVGGSPEYRIRKADEDGGGIAFADFVWKPTVLIEMKKRGANVSRAELVVAARSGATHHGQSGQATPAPPRLSGL